ncbi:Glycosyl transferase family 2 [Alteromonas infernus]
MKKISIVTVVYNNESHLECCIKSVISQTYTNFEYIIIDGNSTDSTPAIIERYKEKVDIVVSEKDDGIADAMNKAINLATGEYIAFIHADDYMHDKYALEKVAPYIENGNDLLLCDILYGKSLLRKTSRGLDWLTRFKTGIWHQGCLCARSVFTKHGSFNKDIPIAMDYEFFLRLYLKDVRVAFCPHILAVMRDTGISSRNDWETLKKRFNDEKKIHSIHANSVPMKFLYGLYWCLYFPYRKIRHIFQYQQPPR